MRCSPRHPVLFRLYHHLPPDCGTNIDNGHQDTGKDDDAGGDVEEASLHLYLQHSRQDTNVAPAKTMPVQPGLQASSWSTAINPNMTT